MVDRKERKKNNREGRNEEEEDVKEAPLLNYTACAAFLQFWRVAITTASDNLTTRWMNIESEGGGKLIKLVDTFKILKVNLKMSLSLIKLYQ